MKPMSLLIVENLAVFYGSIQALRGISLRVEPGEVVTLIGANGAGKSTTLRTISGLLQPKQGTIQFDGQPIQGWAPHRVVKSGLVQVPEGREIFANLTVDENLQLATFARKDRAAIRSDRERALELVSADRERLRQQAGTLSGGEQQMLAIARALVARPKLLMLDEPSLGLAPQLVRSIFQVIREINREGTTILLVEQNANMALHVAHRAYVIEVGEIRMEGPAAELAASDEIRKAYLGHTNRRWATNPRTSIVASSPKSGRPDSNRRHPAWEASTLPTELRPHSCGRLCGCQHQSNPRVAAADKQPASGTSSGRPS